MRFGMLLAALMFAAPVNAATVISGTLSPASGVIDFWREDVVSALSKPSLKSFTLSITNGVIAEAVVYANYSYSYDEYEADNPANVGNNYYHFETCNFNNADPDGCWNTFVPGEFEPGPTWMQSLSVGQRTLTFNVNQPRTYYNCTEPPAIGQCSYFWSGDLSTNVKIASHRPVNYTWTIETFGGSVPEPATWTMMIMGFGIAGLGLRRRQSYLPLSS